MGSLSDHVLEQSLVAVRALALFEEPDQFGNHEAPEFLVLQEGPVTAETSREWALLQRVYGNFISADVRAMCEGRGPILERLLDDVSRKRVREAMLNLHREATYPEPSPWRVCTMLWRVRSAPISKDEPGDGRLARRADALALNGV